MAARKRRQEVKETRRRPATTPEARENQMVSAAFDLAEEQISNGTASSQVVTHFLKLGTAREKLELRKLETEVELAKAKIDAIESHKRVEELYVDAIKAMRSYAGDEPLPEADDEDSTIL